MGDDSVILARYTPKVEPETGEAGILENGQTRTSGRHSNGSANHVAVFNRRKDTSPEGDHQLENVVKTEEDVESAPCGWGPLSLAWCQRFRDPRWFVVVITLCGACQGMAINGFVNTVISTLERRFEITSTESGLIASCYDIMFVLLVIPISYFGGRGHKPRYLGIGILVLGLGSFVFSLPHFITEEYVVENAKETTCMRPDPAGVSGNSTVKSDPCASSLPSTLSNYRYFFFLGQLLHGAGATALYTLGVVYLDENVSPRSSSFYNGIFYTGAVIGPAIGFILGSEFLSYFTEPGVDAKSMGLDTNNPKWVGRWWLGFLISGVFAALLSLPLLAFPRSLPGLVVVPTGGGATLASGYLVRRFNMKMRGILKFCTVLSALLCFFALAFLMECRNAPFAGVTLPYGQANTQCIPDHQRSFGLGIQWIVARCLGSIPGPIMFGKMFDLACVVWQERCDGTGSCFSYNNHHMSVNLMILAAVFCVAAALAFGFALFFYKVKDTGDPEDIDISLEIQPVASGESNKAFTAQEGSDSNHSNHSNEGQAWEEGSAGPGTGPCYDNQTMDHAS
ncbi:solute carrier organic anion transporter family member [Elysia marginata]|uniref:Solute carrier organic anion transporter family member n=1 Tax=Elysia marginata TaxID=1093978 RepID=A0AAV4IQ90_9GAST|nr:solute carrier organic anion transporter family member [Elysia marginata]